MNFNWTGENNEAFKEYVEKSSAQMKEHKKFVHELIDPWLEDMKHSAMSDNDKKQKQKELIDLASFIQMHDPTVKIIDGLSEKPDFVIHQGNKRVGVELVDVYHNKTAKQREGTFQRFFEDIEKELLKVDPQIKGIYRIDFTNELLVFDRRIKEELKPIILSAILNGKPIESKYIRFIRKSPHTQIHLYTSKAGGVGNLKREVIEEIVGQKNAIAAGYESADLSSTWLLMVIPGVQESSDYDQIESSILELPFATVYDRLFLYDFFGRDLHELGVKKL